jgi:hypothetical protein
VAEPVPAPEPVKRPVLSPDPEQTWRPGPRKPTQFQENRAFWKLETQQYVLLLMAVVVIIGIVMVIVLLSSIVHPPAQTPGP